MQPVVRTVDRLEVGRAVVVDGEAVQPQHELIASGATTVAIAEQPQVSDRTVKRLTATPPRKPRVTSRTEVAALAGSAGML